MKIILCQAKKKKDIGSELDNHCHQCMTALSQIYLFPNYVEYHHHWAQEVWNQYQDIPKIKKTGKFPDKNFILDNTWYGNYTYLETSMDNAIYHEDGLEYDQTRYTDIDRIHDIMKEYFYWMAERLSKFGHISFNEVQRELKHLKLMK